MSLLCTKISWTEIKLTVIGQDIALPDVSRQFDSTGSPPSRQRRRLLATVLK